MKETGGDGRNVTIKSIKIQMKFRNTKVSAKKKLHGIWWALNVMAQKQTLEPGVSGGNSISL